MFHPAKLTFPGLFRKRDFSRKKVNKAGYYDEASRESFPLFIGKRRSVAGRKCEINGAKNHISLAMAG